VRRDGGTHALAIIRARADNARTTAATKRGSTRRAKTLTMTIVASVHVKSTRASNATRDIASDDSTVAFIIA
jgi:hypothetical protein